MLSEPLNPELSPGSAEDVDADDVSKYESASSGDASDDSDSDDGSSSDGTERGGSDAPVYGTDEYRLAFLAACEARGASPSAAEGVYAAFVEAQSLFKEPAADEGAQATGGVPDGGVPPASAADADELTAAVGLLTLHSSAPTPYSSAAAPSVVSADPGPSESRRSRTAYESYASKPAPLPPQAAPAAAVTRPLPSVYVAPAPASRAPTLPAPGAARRSAGPPGAPGRSGASYDYSPSPSPSPPPSRSSETPPPPPTSQYSFLNPHPVGGWNDAPPDVLARRKSITPDPAKKAPKRRVYAGQSARSSGSPSPTPPVATLPTPGRQPLELTQEQQTSVNEQLADLAGPGPRRPVSLTPGGGAPPPPPRQRLASAPAPSRSPAASPAPSRIKFCSGPGQPVELCSETQDADLKRCRAEAVRFMDSTFGPGTQVREIIGGSCPRSHVVVSRESLDRWRSGIDERRFLELQVFRDEVQIDLWHIFEDGTTTPVGRPSLSPATSMPGMKQQSSAPTPDDSDDDQDFQPAPSTPSASPTMAKTATLLRDNIARLSERGERLDSVVDSTDSLAISSAAFRKGAGRSKASRMSFSPADFFGKIFGVSSPPASPSPRAGGGQPGLSFELPQPGPSSVSYAQPSLYAHPSPYASAPSGPSPFGAPASSYGAPSPFAAGAPAPSMGYADFAQAGPLYVPAADGGLPNEMLLDESAYPLVYDDALAYPSPPAHPYYNPAATVAPNDIFQPQPIFPLPLPADPFAYQQPVAYESAPAAAASTSSYAPIVYSPPPAPTTLPPPIAEPTPKKKRAPRASTSASHPGRPSDKFPSAEFKAWFKLEEHYTLEADGSWQCTQDACVRHNAPGSGARRKVGHYTGPQATFRLAAMKHVNKHLEENKPEDAVVQLERLLGIVPAAKGASRGIDPVAFIMANVPKSQNDFDIAQTPLSYATDLSNPYDLNGYQSSASSSDPRGSSYASSTPSFSTGSPGSPPAPPSAPWRITDDYTWVAAESSFHCRACPPRVGQTGGRREGIYKAIGEFNFSSITTRARQHAEKHRASASPSAAPVPAVAYDPAQYYSQMQDPSPPSFYGQAQEPSPPSFYNDQPFQQQFVNPQEQLDMLGWATQGPPAPVADAWVPQASTASPGWGY